MVQRLLYVLTYFIRCSELLETHMLDSVEDEAIVIPGSLITTSLRRGEVEESDYVLVTVHKPSGDYLSQSTAGAEGGSCPSDTHSIQSSTYTDTGLGPDDEPSQSSQNTITHTHMHTVTYYKCTFNIESVLANCWVSLSLSLSLSRS